jgi:hypothetical protein
VTDSGCDHAPELVSATGSALDPGETWTYECSRETEAPSGACAISAVTNTASASGTGAGTGVSETDSITSTLLCPGEPVDPPVPPPIPITPITPLPLPRPPLPSTVLPAGVRPPAAGTAGTASFKLPPHCISRAPQLRLTGRRLASIRVTVDGRVVTRETLQFLQRTTRPLHRLFPPGRHRVSIRVEFQPGSETPAVTLTRTITVCAPRVTVPRFTG